MRKGIVKTFVFDLSEKQLMAINMKCFHGKNDGNFKASKHAANIKNESFFFINLLGLFVSNKCYKLINLDEQIFYTE